MYDYNSKFRTELMFTLHKYKLMPNNDLAKIRLKEFCLKLIEMDIPDKPLGFRVSVYSFCNHFIENQEISKEKVESFLEEVKESCRYIN
jgi:hypothetical protein